MHQYIIKRYKLYLSFQLLFMEMMDEKKKHKKRPSRSQEKKNKIYFSSSPKDLTALPFHSPSLSSSPLTEAIQPSLYPSQVTPCSSYQYSKYIKERKEMLRSVWNEITILTQLHHTYIARYYQSWMEYHENDGNIMESVSTIAEEEHSAVNRPSSVSPKYLCIQMEYCGGRNLEFEIKSHEYQADKTIAWTYFRQILEALVYIHRNFVYHRSLKSSNIFVESDAYGRNIKLSDFGISHLLGYPLSDLDALYIPPEVESDCIYDSKSDVYALGILFFEMWYPFFHDLDEKIKVLTTLVQQHIFPDIFLQTVPTEVVVILQ
ncbi:hypothetical protein IE077_002123 [Cardiosporidium cionae]|uniref:Protein kinase domain-containing protein n=1 Tax=Cardiosporidium cionae TaxID=476202 RepID=A0ABQ7J3W1_9APIC|nr:hypothetical protein IE077_002123 [Cardiosporidium cionae]|eukprot:KAF8817754.1 hypothetical protein IE077_002123 [Cardiosporidium cionae]